MRKKLGLVCGNVNAHGTIALASLTGETEVERVLDLLAAPAIANDAIFSGLALGHFPEQVSAAAGGVLFFAGGAVAGTHDTAFVAAAFSHAHAAQGRVRQAALIGGKLEASCRLPGSIVRSQAKILVELV